MTHHDVVIVGSGLMGAAVARCLREARPDVTIAMVDGGSSIGRSPGRHVHDLAELELWEVYNDQVVPGIQSFYTGVAPTPKVRGSLHQARPGMYHLASIGHDADAMPAAAVAWNVGGMGVHWAAACPPPWGAEVTAFLPAEEWDADVARAAELCRVSTTSYPPTKAGRAVAAVLHPLLDPLSDAGRNLQSMHLAINPTPSGSLQRTGPSTIFAPIEDQGADPGFELLAQTLATALVHTDGRVAGVEVLDLRDGRRRTLGASQVVVCADALRTPQLLFASGIRPFALGRYINEHVFLTGRVIADLDRLGVDLADLVPASDQEWAADCFWLPHSGPIRPSQVNMMSTVMVDEQRRPLAYAVGVEVYVPTQVRGDNALEFDGTRLDAAGMPRITIRFDLTEHDAAEVERGRALQRLIAEALGPFAPDTESAVLPAGSSLHVTGTVRMGAEDDGTSVCDPDCRVWGFDNLFLAGCGVIPTALACNATLTGMTTAVRAARAVAARHQR